MRSITLQHVGSGCTRVGDRYVSRCSSPFLDRTPGLDGMRRPLSAEYAVAGPPSRRECANDQRHRHLSAVARKYGVSAAQLFRWRRLAEEGALEAMGAEEAVVPESEVKQLRHQIRELQRLLGKKTLEAEILKEAL